MSSVTAGLVAGGSSVILVAGSARAQNYSGVTDCDLGNGADRPGYGTGQRNQYTDSDTGPNSDPRCHGRGPAAQREGGPSGAGNYGGQASTCTDTDSGSNADPGGRGRCGRPRGSPPSTTRHCTDADSGESHDPVGYGRHC
jgi:hypothetical protein